MMRVLAATDLSDAADHALREGAALAATAGGAFAVIHVLPPLHPISVLDARATEAVRARVARVAEPHELFVEVGSAYAEIVRRAEGWRADTVIVGSHGQSGIARVLGGVAGRVVRHAHCRVLVVRPSPARGLVLAATDLSEPSLPAIVAGAEEARRRGARLRVVHAVGFLELQLALLREAGSAAPRGHGNGNDGWLRQLRAIVAGAGIDAECAILENDAAAAVARDAESSGAEVVVVGCHGRTGLARVALGSVAEKIVRVAPCSVLVVR